MHRSHTATSRADRASEAASTRPTGDVATQRSGRASRWPASLRVAVGLHSLQLGGSQINTVDLATELRRRGHHVTLFAIDDGFPYKATILPVAEAADLPVEILPGEPGFVAQARHITRLIDRHDPHVVHVNHEGHMIGPLGGLAMRSRPGRALVVTNWIMENSAWLPRHAPLIVGTEALRRDAAGRHRARVWLIEPPVNTAREQVDAEEVEAFRRTLGVADGDIMAVQVTRVDRTMKLDSILHAIRAVAVLAEPRLRLVIVGDGDAADVVRADADQVNASLGRPAVLLTGALADPRPAYGAADIVLGMGGSALRGLAFEKPVIVQGAGTFARTFSDATASYFLEHGFFGDADDDPSGALLAGEIHHLLDARARAELAGLGSRMVRDRFSLDVATTKLEAVYRHAVDNAPSLHTRWIDAAFLMGGYAGVRWLPPRLYQGLRPALRALALGRARPRA